MDHGLNPKNGFTLIELMLVVCVLSLLALVALPKFGDSLVRAKEAAIKGQLSTFRSAISIYYSDNEGVFPTDPFYDLTAKYLRRLPHISMPPVPAQGNPGHVYHNYQHSMVQPDSANGGAIDDPVDHGWDNFHWYYYDSGPMQGTIVVMCTHNSSMGKVWSSY